LPEELKGRKLSEIRVINIDEALATIHSSRMRKYAFTVLHNALGKAFRLDLIPTAIMEKAERPRHKSKESKPLTHAEQTQFLHDIENTPQRELFLFYLYTGVRRTEALRVTWSDVDFKGKAVRIEGTKSETSKRTLYMLPEVETLLIRQRERGLKGARVFPYAPNYIDRVFRRICPNHHLHDLRHTFITRCAESGINVNVTQRLAGHSDVKLTLRIYTHVTDEFRKSEYEKFKL
jgi:integrase